MNFRCDIYAYQSSEGYVIHVANNRFVGVEDLPELPNYSLPYEEWGEAYRKRNEIFDNLGREDIDLPYAGETFIEKTLGDFKRRMEELRGIGYNFPDHVFEDIRVEELNDR